jgi:hypothetical protein
MTPLNAAVKRGDVNAVKDLLAKEPNTCEKVTSYLWANNLSCGSEMYRILMDNAYELVNKGGQCPSLLYHAAALGCDDTIKKLLEKGQNPNGLVSYGGPLQHTALGAAAFNGQLEVAKILINKGADSDLAIYWLKKSGDRGSALGVEMINRLKAKQVEPTTITATGTASSPALEKPNIKSDIDELPAIKVKPNKNAYAIVIGIENYRQKLPKADFAAQDARLVADYLTKAMGYPEENVITLLNDHASNVDLAKYFEKWLPNNVEIGSTVFVYFSGHGAPDPKSGNAYLVPYDGDPSFIDQTGYSLRRMYDALGKLPAKEIIIALDSCFSGAGGRSVLAEGARPLVMNLQKSVVLSKNMTVMAAASGDQISSTYKDKGHGLFTYFMLKGIKNEDVVKKDGSIKMDDLFDYLKPQVERIARKQYNNEQTPQLIGAKKN